MKHIHNKVLDETGTNLMNEVIENYLRTGETDIAEPYAALVKEAAVFYVQEIFQKLKDYEAETGETEENEFLDFSFGG